MSKFDYLDKTLIVLSATSGGISIISLTTVIGVPVGIESASFSLAFSLSTVVIKKLLKVTRKKKKHNKTIVLAKSKLNSVENLKYQALIDLEISHKEFKTTVNEKERYEEMKGNIRSININDEKDE